MIEKTINDNFAGTGIAKFVVGEAWNGASKDLKKDYIKNFKRHLALNIASMMQVYSNQKYELLETKIDNKNKIVLIDMEIFSDTGSVIITWRVKESKGRYFVIDLIVADISLVVTKRSEFNSMLKSVDYNLSEFNKILYDILLKFDLSKTNDKKIVVNTTLVKKYFSDLNTKKHTNLTLFIDYFGRFYDFCFELPLNNMLEEAINFKY